MIAATVRCGPVDVPENRLDLGQFQMMDLTRGGSLQRSTQDPLRLRQVLGIVRSHKAEEGTDGAQPHVPRTGLIVPSCLQMQQKGHDLLVGQVLHGQLTGIGRLPRHELQEKLETVAVAVQRVKTQRPLPRQIVG